VINVSEATRFDCPVLQEDNTVNDQFLRKYGQEVGQDMEQSMSTLFKPLRVLYHVVLGQSVIENLRGEVRCCITQFDIAVRDGLS
jgi:hypothetical protein